MESEQYNLCRTGGSETAWELWYAEDFNHIHAWSWDKDFLTQGDVQMKIKFNKDIFRVTVRF